MQIAITIITGTLAIIGFYWAFIEQKDINTHNIDR